ncbi:MAG: hypothetical protein WA775_10205 [Psychroserpens sp.]|uniref:hypothetical protein n=1 Tax=Psychroserpens sp. TaxID=2020870 RepID=UPI003CBE6B9F
MLERITNRLFKGIAIDKLKENFTTLQVDYTCHDLVDFKNRLTIENYNLLNNNLKTYGYKWDIYIENYYYSVSQIEFKELDVDINDDISDFSIVFKIHKTGGKLLIFDNSAFQDFLESLSLEELLLAMSDKHLPITFIGDNFSIENSFKKENNLRLSSQCNFRNQAQFPFSPDFFYIKEKAPNYLDKFFSKISFIFTLVYIFNSSEITKNEIKLYLYGSKSINFLLNFHDIDLGLFNHYYRIYNWIYSVESQVEDKIGLSRNILTSYLKENSLKIDNSVFDSILSSNKLYIKDNISKYFEVRGKIIEKIEQTVQDVNKSISSFVNNFQKSSFLFLSYFFSVFIFRVVNKATLNNIFTAETSLLGIGFLGVSFFYLIGSLIILYLDYRRLNKRYTNIKIRYEDVLIKRDIMTILNNDAEYNDEIQHLCSRVFVYSVLWIIFLIIFLVILFLTSDYLEFHL